MNYLAHGRESLDHPFLLAGTALPDWLRVLERRLKVSEDQVGRALESGEEDVVAMARGARRHHQDDRWFHRNAVFVELSARVTLLLRECVTAAPGYRPSFLAHLLVELLLDAGLQKRHPPLLECYYSSLGGLGSGRVVEVAEAILERALPGLERLFRAFCEQRFLEDYTQDERLVFRVDQVLARVGLPRLPQELMGLLPELRGMVDAEQRRLLTPPEA